MMGMCQERRERAHEGDTKEDVKSIFGIFFYGRALANGIRCHMIGVGTESMFGIDGI